MEADLYIAKNAIPNEGLQEDISLEVIATAIYGCPFCHQNMSLWPPIIIS